VSFIGKLVRMDLPPPHPHYGETGVIIRVRKPTGGTGDTYIESRIRYDILVGDEVLHDQLYEYFVELDLREV
jgi:hypothetical protein